MERIRKKYALYFHLVIFLEKKYAEISESIQILISRFWNPYPKEWPTFDEIIKDFDENEDKYINKSINECDFYDYREFIKEYKSSFDFTFNSFCRFRHQ